MPSAEIAARYADTEWEIIGPPEIRNVDPTAGYFSPWKALPDAEMRLAEERPPEMPPHLPSLHESTKQKRSLRMFFCADTSRTAPGAKATRK